MFQGHSVDSGRSRRRAEVKRQEGRVYDEVRSLDERGLSLEAYEERAVPLTY